MQPFERQQALDFATSTLANRDPDCVWGTGERMAAMVRMYELTFDRRYLDHLHEFAQARPDRSKGTRSNARQSQAAA